MTQAPAAAVGVNTRNLRTLEVDAERLAASSPPLPDGPRVAESGIEIAATMRRASRARATAWRWSAPR